MNAGTGMPRFMRRLVDHRTAGTLATSMRQRRFKLFLNLIAPLPRPVQILDLGGEEIFWEHDGADRRERGRYHFVKLLSD